MDMRICPYCGKEMVRGSLPNETPPYFLPAGERAPLFRMIVPRSGIELVPDPSATVWQEAIAYYCKDCRIVVAQTRE